MTYTNNNLSELTLTVTHGKKSVVPTGTVSIREQINVNIPGMGVNVADGIVLKVQIMGDNGATTPIGTCSTWSRVDSSGASGTGPTHTYAIGVLNLNTVEAIAAFSAVGNIGSRGFNITVGTTTGPVAECNGVLTVMNFPSPVTADPITVSQISTIAALDARITLLEAADLECVNHADFAGVTAIETGAALSMKVIANKVNEILTILKG